MKTALITCGAVGREVRAIVNKYGWDASVLGISARDHLFPQRITPDVEARLLKISDQYDHVIVVFGDCGTYGAYPVWLLGNSGDEPFRATACASLPSSHRPADGAG